MSGITFSTALTTPVEPPPPPPPSPPPLPFYPLVHIWSSRCMDYGPSHAWHRTQRLRYIIILVENDVMHFKTFVLRTPSVPPQMMSLALSLRQRSCQVGCGVFLVWCCRHRVVGLWYWVTSGKEGKRVNLDVGNCLLLNQRIMWLVIDVLGVTVLTWSFGSGTEETDTLDMTWLQIRVWPICIFGACCQWQDFWIKVVDCGYFTSIINIF